MKQLPAAALAPQNVAAHRDTDHHFRPSGSRSPCPHESGRPSLASSACSFCAAPAGFGFFFSMKPSTPVQPMMRSAPTIDCPVGFCASGKTET